MAHLDQFLPNKVGISSNLVDWYRRKTADQPEEQNTDMRKSAHPVWDVDQDGTLERKQAETIERTKQHGQELVPNLLGAKASTLIGGRRVAGRITMHKEGAVTIETPNGMKLANIGLSFVDFE